MKMPRSLLLCSMVLAVCPALSVVADEVSTALEASEEISPSRIAAFRTNLEKDGFAVTDWSFGSVNVAALVCRGLLASGYGNNAGAPYVTFTNQVEGVTVPKEFQLQSNDAVILIGKTPPPVAYFSYLIYLRRHYDDKSHQRKLVFASLGDAMNLHTLKTSAGMGSGPFKRDFVIVTTADRGIDARIQSAAGLAGISQGIFNTAVIPTSLVTLGAGSTSDTLLFLHRLFLPETGHQNDVEEYLKDPGAVVFHVRPKTPPAQPDPYPMPDLRIRGTGHTEMDLMPALQALRKAILQEHAALHAAEFTTSVWLTEADDGIQRGINLLGETRDTSYLRSNFFRLPNSPDEFLVLYGVNHEAVGKATYSNFSIYNKEKELGIAGEHSRHLAGSADRYDLGPYQHQARFLYVWKAARDCNGDPDCLTISLPPDIGDCPPVDLDTDLFVAFRAYVEPETCVGPAWHEILYDQAIRFTPRK